MVRVIQATRRYSFALEIDSQHQLRVSVYKGERKRDIKVEIIGHEIIECGRLVA